MALEPPVPRFQLASLMLERPSPPPHEWTAVCLPHEQLRLAWGRDHGRAYEPEWQRPGGGPARPKLAEIVFKGTSEAAGTTIERYRYAAVDSGRCYLPSPRQVRVGEGKWQWRTSSFECILIRLLNDLGVTSRSADAYLPETAINVKN